MLHLFEKISVRVEVGLRFLRDPICHIPKFLNFWDLSENTRTTYLPVQLGIGSPSKLGEFRIFVGWEQTLKNLKLNNL